MQYTKQIHSARVLKMICSVSVLLASFFHTTAQAVGADTSLAFKLPLKEFVVVYDIHIKGKKTEGIAETYNGGTQTAFVQGDKIRLRLVSLMRIQSLFFQRQKKAGEPAAVMLKESGAKKTRVNFSEKQWAFYNQKYDNARCDLQNGDSLMILNHQCAKAVISTRGGDQLTVYYLPGPRNETFTSAQPLFSGLPGLPLKYLYTKGEKTIEYTASSVTLQPISPDVFTLPAHGYTLQPFSRGKAGVNVNDLDNKGSENDPGDARGLK